MGGHDPNHESGYSECYNKNCDGSPEGGFSAQYSDFLFDDRISGTCFTGFWGAEAGEGTDGTGAFSRVLFEKPVKGSGQPGLFQIAAKTVKIKRDTAKGYRSVFRIVEAPGCARVSIAGKSDRTGIDDISDSLCHLKVGHGKSEGGSIL